MVPNVAGTGHSFKGAALYYLHDKRREGEAERLSSDRVAWTHTRNLATENPELAWKIMAATALDQDRLKRDAGVKNTGRKSSATVYAYSIAWHPEETGKLSREEMLQAAEDSIRVLGADDRQALIVCHRDEPHPHVHVMLNRVSPTDGRMLGTSNDRLKLSEWALAYRRARGEERKYCPQREQNVEARKQGRKVRSHSPTPRAMEKDYAQAMEAGAAEAALKERERRKADTARLKANDEAMRSRHKAEWEKLSASYREKKDRLQAEALANKQRGKEAVAMQYRPLWRDLFRLQERETERFLERETRLAGKIRNAMEAVLHRGLTDPESSRGFLSAAMNYMVSRPAREDALKKLQARERKALAGRQRQDAYEAARVAGRESQVQRQMARATFMSERAALIVRQTEDRERQKAAWKNLSAERRQGFSAAIEEARVKRAEREQVSARRDFTRVETKAAFDRAAKPRGRGLGLRRSRPRGE